MKGLKILLVVFVIFGSTFILLLINYARINIRYLISKKDYKDSITIVGNKDGYIPQGLAYSKEYDVVLQTSYNSKHKVSKLYVIDFKTNKLLKELKLLNIDNSENKTHVGGIAVYDDRVWITSDYLVNEFDLEEIITTEYDSIKSIYEKKLSIRGDFATSNDKYLIIGDFFLNPFYKVPNNTPLMYFYDLNEDIDYDTPKYIATLPKMVQGLTITDDNKYIFTRSFTYLINSDLVIYDNPLDFESTTYTLNDEEIPLYHFNNNNLINNIKLPPMAEGLFNKDNKLYILFESSCDTYLPAYPKIKNIIELDINKIDRN